MQLASPLYVVWETTLDCNAKCIHCYSDALFGRGPEYWPLDESIDLIDQIADAGVIILALSGGEVLLRPDWDKLVEHAVSRGLRVTMASNGLAINQRVAKRLSDLGIWNVSISIDGALATTHDSIRGVPGIFDRACEAVTLLAKEDVRVTVNFTPMRPNIADAPEMIPLAWRLGAEKINLTEYVYTTRGGIGLMPSPEQLRDLLTFWTQAATEWKDRIEVDWHDCRVSLMLLEPESQKYTGCGAGYTHCRITVDKDVTPCVVLPTPVGNLRTERFMDIWMNSPGLHRIRSRDNITSGNCSQCEYKSRCGGCRAASHACHGTPYAGDPTCWIKPEPLDLQPGLPTYSQIVEL